jgi:hypothetical protein
MLVAISLAALCEANPWHALCCPALSCHAFGE